MENYLLPVFIVNIFLVLSDASLGHFIVPYLIRRTVGDDDEARRASRSTPLLLAVAVAVYMFFNCLAYSRQSLLLLLVLAGFILIDVVGQILVCCRIGKSEQH
jgi:hypothetical protein